MKIVVTGAAGHIGSYVIRDLAKQFHCAEIILIDNLMTQRFSSLFNLPSNGRYSFHDIDVTSADITKLFDNADYAIHLAAITDASNSFNNALEVEENNFMATSRVVDACIETGAHLIAISSTSVYGTQNNIVSEECHDDELRPQTPYAETKLKEEQLITSKSTEQGLNAIICRFGTIFGSSVGMRFHTAVNKFCWQATMGQPVTVWSTAYDQKRPYLDLQDASRVISFIIQNDLFDGCIYNVLTHNSTVHEIIDCIREFIPDLEITFVDNQIMNQLSYEVSCERILGKGFVFRGNLRRGIRETIALLRFANSLK